MGWRGFSNITPAKLNVLIVLQKLQHADASPPKKDWHQHKTTTAPPTTFTPKIGNTTIINMKQVFPDSWILDRCRQGSGESTDSTPLEESAELPKILEGAVCSVAGWAVLLREVRDSDASQTSWFVIPSSGWQWFWFRLWFSIVRGLWLTCYGTSSSHWAKPQGDALQGIIPHSGDRQKCGVKAQIGQTVVPGHLLKGPRAMTVAQWGWCFSAVGRPFSFGLGVCRVKKHNSNSVSKDSFGSFNDWVLNLTFLSFILLLARLLARKIQLVFAVATPCSSCMPWHWAKQHESDGCLRGWDPVRTGLLAL